MTELRDAQRALEAAQQALAAEPPGLPDLEKKWTAEVLEQMREDRARIC